MKSYKLNINGTKYSVDIKEVEGQEINLEVNGTPYTVTVDKEMKPTKVAAPKVVSKAATQATAGVVPPAAKAKAATVNSPLPGTILKIFVKEGDWAALSNHDFEVVTLVNGSEKTNAVVKEVQRNYLKDYVVHIDFHAVEA